jgi:hypothetical protein
MSTEITGYLTPGLSLYFRHTRRTRRTRSRRTRTRRTRSRRTRTSTLVTRRKRTRGRTRTRWHWGRLIVFHSIPHSSVRFIPPCISVGSHGELQTGDGEPARLDGVAYGASGGRRGVGEVRHRSADHDGEHVHGHEKRTQSGFARKDGHPGDPEQRASEIQQSEERVIEASIDVLELRQS